MAAKEGTKKAKAEKPEKVKEEVVETAEIVNKPVEEVVETAEIVNKPVIEEEKVNEPDTEEAVTENAEEQAENVISEDISVKADGTENEPKQEEFDGLSNERILEIEEEINKHGESLNDLNGTGTELEQQLKEKISNLEKIEDELRKDIEINEAKLGKENKSAAEKLFRRGFTDFWNGVSDGWNN